MKSLMLISISVLVFTEIIPLCHCCICCKTGTNSQPDDLLPEWLKVWATPGYGLEFPDGYSEEELKHPETIEEQLTNEKVTQFFQERVDKHIKLKREAGEPEFKIARLDAISYKHEDKKMLLILRNLQFFNLKNYEKVESKYEVKGKYQKETSVVKKKDKDRRKDIVWTINMRSKFLTSPGDTDSVSREILTSFNKMQLDKSEENEISAEPVTIKMNFEIKPESSNDTAALKASGFVEIRLHGLSFDLLLVIKQIQETLVSHLPAAIRAHNRVPDFTLKYGMDKIEIREIKLGEYVNEIDDSNTVMYYEFEDVNPGGKKKERYPKERNFSKIASPEVKTCIENTDLENKVKEHLNEVITQITDEEHREDVMQRICINLMYKMTWKIMQMHTKLQLPNIFLDILQYEKDFNRRLQVDELQLTKAETTVMVLQYTKQVVQAGISSSISWFKGGKSGA